MKNEPTEIERVADSLWRVPLITPTVPPATRTNTYVVKDGAGLWIIDPGSSHRTEIRRLIELLETQLTDRPPAGYIVTHHHPDHWGALTSLLSWRDAPVVAYSPDLLRGIDASFLTPGDLECKDGGLRLIHTPGHASDHLVVLTPEGDVVAGDLVAGVGTVVIDPPDGDLADYLDSLNQLLAVHPKRLFPAHGPTIENGPAKLEEYVAHRLMREAQVLDGLRSLGASKPAQLVPGIYPDVPNILHPLAARSVLAHLLKLRRDGRVAQDGRRWHLV